MLGLLIEDVTLIKQRQLTAAVPGRWWSKAPELVDVAS